MKKKVYLPAKKTIEVSAGESVRIIRELQELSQCGLAEVTGIARSAISAIEQDRIRLSIKRAKLLARALKVPVVQAPNIISILSQPETTPHSSCQSTRSYSPNRTFALTCQRSKKWRLQLNPSAYFKTSSLPRPSMDMHSSRVGDASKLAGLTEVPVRVTNVAADKIDVLAILENIQRAEMTAADEIAAVVRLAEVFNGNQESIRAARDVLDGKPKRQSSGALPGGRAISQAVHFRERKDGTAFTLRVNFDKEMTVPETKAEIVRRLEEILRLSLTGGEKAPVS